MKSILIVMLFGSFSLFGESCNYYLQKNTVDDVPTTNYAVKSVTKKMNKLGYKRVSKKLNATYIIGTVFYRSTDMPFLNSGIVGVILGELENSTKVNTLLNDFYEFSGSKIKKRKMKKKFKKILNRIPECF